jgi:thiol-disulfide isomerase/thioredoxin
MAVTGGSPPDRIRLIGRLLHPPVAAIRARGARRSIGSTAVRSRVVVASLVVAASLAGCSSSLKDLRYARISGPMPPISGQTLTGGRIEPGDPRGKVLVLNFWNQDCPPCRGEMPLLDQEARRLRAKGVVVIGVLFVSGNWPDDPPAARAFLERLHVTYPTLLDPSSVLARELNIAGIPSTIVADRSGKKRWQILGRLHPGQLEELLAKIGSY